ncbi:F-box protein SKIP14 [Sesamum angolense]|uniref:F-box protein SKIP14 n=1 Tax=Sesamum angolense TaxID=2727404 RepID=A0AAE2BVS9_9LAMI|nr:F-box protein SKIP14 [Sesamum angolense]
MALNYSQRPLFPAHVSEDNLVSPMRIVNGYRIEGVPEKNREGYLSGWLEDLEVEYGGYVKRDTGKTSQDNYGLFAGWNLIWNNSLKFQPFPSNCQFNEKLNNGFQSFPSNTQVYEKPDVGVHSLPSGVQGYEKLDVAGKVDQVGEERDIGDALAPYEFGFQLACNRGDNVGYSNETCCSSELQCCEEVEDATESEGVPHEALTFALSYLRVKDLLSVERVCRLALMYTCQFYIVDDVKLCVPGCTRLTIEGILNSIKAHNSKKDVPAEGCQVTDMASQVCRACTLCIARVLFIQEILLWKADDLPVLEGSDLGFTFHLNNVSPHYELLQMGEVQDPIDRPMMPRWSCIRPFFLFAPSDLDLDFVYFFLGFL